MIIMLDLNCLYPETHSQLTNSEILGGMIEVNAAD